MNVKKLFNTTLLIFLTLTMQATQATVVKFETVLGDFEVQLFDEEAPQTVENFLNYVNDGDYDNSFIHRSIPEFVIQGGGWRITENELIQPVPARDPVDNEFNLSNLRGTLAMAKIQGDPNSARNEWFFNLEDNSNPLDTTEGGFTVFGEVMGSGMDIVDAIGDLQVFNVQGTAFTNIPFINYSGGVIQVENFVLINRISVVQDEFAINAGLSGVWFNPETSGQGIVLEVLPNINQVFFSWFTYDSAAPAGEVDANIGAPEHRWFTGLGPIEGNSVTLDLLSSTGGLFNNSVDVTNTTVGNLSIRFSDCANATVEYSFTDTGLTGEFNIRRVASDNVVLCEQLGE